MNPVYLIKKTNICISNCCHCNQPACAIVVAVTLNEFNAIKLKERFEAECKIGCDTDDQCFSYCIERLFLKGDHEYML